MFSGAVYASLRFPHTKHSMPPRDHLAQKSSFSSLLSATQACLNIPVLRAARLTEAANADLIVPHPLSLKDLRPRVEIISEQNVIEAYEKWEAAIGYSAAQPLAISDLHSYRLFLKQMHPVVFDSPSDEGKYLTKEAALILLDTLMTEGSVPRRQAHNEPPSSYVQALISFYAKPVATRKAAYHDTLSEIGLSLE